MEKIGRILIAILSTAWYAALTFFCFAVFGTALMQVADKLLNNNIVECVLLGVGLIWLTAITGSYIKKKANKER